MILMAAGRRNGDLGINYGKSTEGAIKDYGFIGYVVGG